MSLEHKAIKEVSKDMFLGFVGDDRRCMAGLTSSDAFDNDDHATEPALSSGPVSGGWRFTSHEFAIHDSQCGTSM